MQSHASKALLAVVLLCAGAGVCAAADSPSPSKLSSSAGPMIVEAQKLIQSKDFPGAMAKLKAAQAASDKPFDNYIIDRLIVSAAVGMNDMATAASAEEAAADSPSMPEADKKGVLHDALQLSAYMKQWPKTIAYGQQLGQINALDAQTAGNVAIAYYNTNDFARAQQYAQQSIQLAKAAGQAPDQNALEIVMSAQVKQNNQSGAAQTLEQIAMQTGTPEAWAQLIGVAFGTPGIGNLQALYLYRLLQTAGAMKNDDYKVMASDANDLGYPTEALRCLEQGISSGKISGGEVGAVLSRARRDAAVDERSLPQIAASAAKSRTGEQDVKLGEDYWGYGRYADAEAAARTGVSKGGLKTPWEGPLLIGAAEVAQGKYADAVQALSQVNGNAAVTKAAHLWSLYAQSKSAPASAAAPAAQIPPR